MEIKKLTDDISVAAQITSDDVTDIANKGYRSVICNRPDAEQIAQPDFYEIEQAAGDVGLQVAYIPVVSAGLTKEDVGAFARCLNDMPKPILAYCRSGTRSTVLWAITQVGRMPDEEIVRRAADAGYDVSSIVQQLNNAR